MRIKLIVTGVMERKALSESLRRVFSNTGCPDDIEFMSPHRVDPTTSARLPRVDSGGIPKQIERLVKAILAELQYGSEGIKADMAMGIDDLELANLDQPGVVIGWVRRTVEEEINKCSSQREAARVRKLFKERSSFHLLKPMSEAYFYAERAALLRAGVKNEVPVHRMGSDVEEFKTDDPGFLDRVQKRKEDDSHRQIIRPSWWCEEKHPKRYLEYLCQQSNTLYHESTDGAKALRSLDWTAAASLPEVVPFARALFEDIADFLGVPSPLGHGSVNPPTYPPRFHQGTSLVMRNI